MRFLSRRRILAALSFIVIAILALIGSGIGYLKSPAFDAKARRYVEQEIQHRTGARVTLNDFGWSFWSRRIRLEDLTLRGLEPSDEAPLAHFSRIDIGVNLRTLLQHRIDLFELTISQPEFHILVTPDGKTNFPTPESQPQGKPFNFDISIQNFNVVDGSGILNEQRVGIDLSLKNLTAVLNYQDTRQVLAAHLRYDGVLDRAPDVKLAIPYTVSADLDYTRSTIVAHRILLTSGKNEVRLQGRINQVLSRSISGKLDYTGDVQARFLNYFFTEERFSGQAAAAGFLEFSDGHFLTQGNTTSDAIDYEGWHVTKLSGVYEYRYPDRRLTFRQLKASAVSGSVSGNAVVENLPGPSRVILDLDYSGIDAAALARAYPWDRKYRIFSNASGTLNGWFEGKLVRFDFSGHVDLKSYTPPAIQEDVVALPIDGSTDYEAQPGQARVMNANGGFYSTALKAEGLIHPTASDMKVSMTSSNLKDIAFLYSDANGSGSFEGTLSGLLTKPLLKGEFTLHNHQYRQWTIQQAAGGIRLDLPAETADLINVRITQGESQILVNGSSALSGSPVDLRVQSNRVTAQDVRPFLNRNVGGVFAGDIHVTSLTPHVNLEGDVTANNLSLDNRLIGNTRGHLRYFEPAIDIEQLSIRQNDSSLTANVSFNRATDAVKFTARVNSIDLRMFHEFGLPDSVQGTIRQADLQGDGTMSRPNVLGNAAFQNLSVYGEAFPQARVELSSSGTELNVRLDAARNMSLTAQIDTAAGGYPFQAHASFTQYPLERIARFSDGTIIATGNANLSGKLSDQNLQGDGRIESAEVRIRDTGLRTTKPFTFEFNSDRLALTGVTLTGQSTQVSLAGTIGFAEHAPLNLDVNGQIDLALISAEYPELKSSGTVDVRVKLGGTVQTWTLAGQAHLANASLGRRDLFTTLSNLNGDLVFDQDRVTLNNAEGRVGGGTVRAEGTALLQGGTIQTMNIQIDAKNARLRGYPEGLRTVLDGSLILRGSWVSPLLEGNVQIQSLSYRSSFEEFLAMLSEEKLKPVSSPIGRLKLSLHVEGGKNITIQNQLADVEARVDIDWKGTVDEPSVTGHIEASGGTLTFQGNRYTVTRGNIDFVDPLNIKPVVDIEAESQLRDYRVILSITGRGDNPKLAMRSDPPLPELEIVSLIAGGRTREEIAARSTISPTSEQLFQSGAASILFDLLQQRVGNRLGLLGTGRVRIDPFLLGAENNPGARITFSQPVTKDLSITYSQDLSSKGQQVIQIEYFVSRNTSILATRDELGNLGLDIRHRTRIK